MEKETICGLKHKQQSTSLQSISVTQKPLSREFNLNWVSGGLFLQVTSRDRSKCKFHLGQQWLLWCPPISEILKCESASRIKECHLLIIYSRNSWGCTMSSWESAGTGDEAVNTCYGLLPSTVISRTWCKRFYTKSTTLKRNLQCHYDSRGEKIQMHVWFWIKQWLTCIHMAKSAASFLLLQRGWRKKHPILFR